MRVPDRHDMSVAVKEALNPNTTNLSTYISRLCENRDKCENLSHTDIVTNYSCIRNILEKKWIHCFDNGYVEKQAVAWKNYCAEFWLKELPESGGIRTGRRNITEMHLKTTLNTIQSVSQSKTWPLVKRCCFEENILH